MSFLRFIGPMDELYMTVDRDTIDRRMTKGEQERERGVTFALSLANGWPPRGNRRRCDSTVDDIHSVPASHRRDAKRGWASYPPDGPSVSRTQQDGSACQENHRQCCPREQEQCLTL